MLNALQQWAWEIKSIVIQRYHHLSPQDYYVMLVVCMAVGLTLLRSNRQ